MAKRLVFLIAFFFLIASPAYAMEWTVYGGYQIEEEEVQQVQPESATDAPAPDVVSGAEVATGSAIFVEGLSELIQPLSNYPTFEDGYPSENYVMFGNRLLNKVSPGEKYVFARTGQYQYIMAIGDFNDSFSGSATVYILNLARSGYDYSYTVLDDSSFSLTVGDNLVYSSVPGYPSLDGYDRTSDILLISALVIACWFGLKFARLVFSPLIGWR